jgi:hypothetical protein
MSKFQDQEAFRKKCTQERDPKVLAQQNIENVKCFNGKLICTGVKDPLAREKQEMVELRKLYKRKWNVRE